MNCVGRSQPLSASPFMCCSLHAPPIEARGVASGRGRCGTIGLNHGKSGISCPVELLAVESIGRADAAHRFGPIEIGHCAWIKMCAFERIQNASVPSPNRLPCTQALGSNGRLHLNVGSCEKTFRSSMI
jgi:hypothetical protein